MNNYKTKVIYNNHENRKVTEFYLIQGVNFSDVETHSTMMLESMSNGEFETPAINKVKYSDIVHFENDKYFYDVKVKLTLIDEVNGKEKLSICKMLVSGNDIIHAYDRAYVLMKDSMSDYEIISIINSKIIDVFKTKED